jgi:hypothetical protein
MPTGALLASSEVARLLDRDAWRLAAVPGRRPGVMIVGCHPIGGGEPYVARPGRGKLCYRDPEMSTIAISEPDSDIEFRFAEPARDLVTAVADSAGEDGLVYRGMSDEEMQAIRETGEVRSDGEWNLGGQDGLTYWTTAISSAAQYSNGFAPMHRRPTFGRPAWILAAHKPSEVRRVRGTAEHEVGVERAVAADEVVAAWRGLVFDFDPGEIELVLGGDGIWRTGSMVQPSARVVWERLEEPELRKALGLPVESVLRS